MSYLFSGIQQVGIGNRNAVELWSWYQKNLGMDVPVFDEEAEAALMLPYTGGQPRKRHAILALNLMGGGGVEIWQYTERKAQQADFDIQPGDLGITSVTYKSFDIKKSHVQLSSENQVSPIYQLGNASFFYLRDPNGNVIKMEEGKDFFSKSKRYHCGGIAGASIGVSDINRSLVFYKDVLGFDQVMIDEEGSFEDLDFISNQSQTYRRVILSHSTPRSGPFSQLLGSNTLELIQGINQTGRKIFKNRFWGDMGYIHLCFDIRGMASLKSHCQKMGHPFTVDSGDFSMGDAGGHFAYIEDPDGTLIEFVEAKKLAIIKPLGWYLHLDKRDPSKPLPRYIIKAMGLKRKKN